MYLSLSLFLKFLSKGRMKRTYISLIVVLVCVLVQAQPQITFDSETKDLGYILWRNPVTVTYNFTNTGNEPLVISNVTVSCGCIDADWTKEPVLSGEKGVITATFDAEAIGRFYKDLGVYCNASTEPVYISFNGEVTAEDKNFSLTHPYQIGAILIDRDELDFDAVYKGERPVIELQVANISNRVYSPVLMHLPPFLETEAVPDKLGRGKTGTIRVTLNTDKLPKLGFTRTSVYLSRYFGDKVSAENEIPVSVALLPDFTHLTDYQRNNPPVISVSSEELIFTDLRPNQKKSGNVVITNTGKSDLVIQDMQVFSTALEASLKKNVLKPGESVRMKITVRAKNLPVVKGGLRVVMITNDPEHPMVTIRIKAQLKSNNK